MKTLQALDVLSVDSTVNRQKPCQIFYSHKRLTFLCLQHVVVFKNVIHTKKAFLFLFRRDTSLLAHNRVAIDYLMIKSDHQQHHSSVVFLPTTINLCKNSRLLQWHSMSYSHIHARNRPLQQFIRSFEQFYVAVGLKFKDSFAKELAETLCCICYFIIILLKKYNNVYCLQQKFVILVTTTSNSMCLIFSACVDGLQIWLNSNASLL